MQTHATLMLVLAPFALLPMAQADNNSAPQVIATTQGDLDGDGIAEYVEVRNTNTQASDGMGLKRELWVYKIQQGKKTLWQHSSTAIYPSQGGGMMGDPFGEISIKKGSLFVSHSGGSSWKWGHTDQYRYPPFPFSFLFSHYPAFRICDYWETVDANLSTGNIHYRKDFDRDKECDNNENRGQKDLKERFVNKNVRLNFANRNTQEVKIIAPKSKQDIYLANPVD